MISYKRIAMAASLMMDLAVLSKIFLSTISLSCRIRAQLVFQQHCQIDSHGIWSRYRHDHRRRASLASRPRSSCRTNYLKALNSRKGTSLEVWTPLQTHMIGLMLFVGTNSDIGLQQFTAMSTHQSQLDYLYIGCPGFDKTPSQPSWSY